MMDKKLQILLILSLTITATFAKIAGYDYQPSQPTVVSPQEQSTYLPPELPQYTYQQQQPLQESYKKEFFIFSAPDEEFEDVHAAHKIASSLQKNVRVVFIRAPEHKGLEHAALQLAKQVSDHKTAIYVLNKQHDFGDLAQRLAAYREQYVQKPEVHFVKYRTRAEAEHAQEQIQSHYDSLRGSSHISNEGAAPVLDFASKAQQLPSYGSAISIAPAFNIGSGVGSGVGSSSGLYNPPAYTSSTAGSSGGLANSALYTQQLLSSNAVEPQSYVQSPQPSEYEKAAANLAALNLLKAYQSQIQSQTQTQSQSQSSYNSNSISSSNIGSYASIGGAAPAGGAGLAAAYGGNGAVDEASSQNFAGLEALGLSANSVDNGAGLASALEAYGVSPRNADRKQMQVGEVAVSKLNERQNLGGKLTFPSDGGLANSYLPPIKRRQL